MTGFGIYDVRTDELNDIRTVVCDDLEAKIESMIAEGFRLDMIVPADAPRIAIVSKGADRIRLAQKPSPVDSVQPPTIAGGTDRKTDTWVTGRAGMEYRDLIPGRVDGKLIASHIRLTVGGEVPDYVHYHKVRFQMIYCVLGAIKVVYEDQGEPFWLHPGDCVLQPPEIRHRVLWAEAGSEVVELGVPAVHETWVEHEITLPTAELKPDRIFNGQRFVRHIADWNADAIVRTNNFEVRDTGISLATDGFADVKVFRGENAAFFPFEFEKNREMVFCFVLSGELSSMSADGSEQMFSDGDAFILRQHHDVAFKCVSETEILLAAF